MLKSFSTRLPLTQSQHGPGFDPMVQGLYRIIRDCGLTESDPGEFLPAETCMHLYYNGTALLRFVCLTDGELSHENIGFFHGDGVIDVSIPENCLGFEWEAPVDTDGFKIEQIRIVKEYTS